MTTPAPAPRPSVALVPGELRGYRQFDLRADGLYPLVRAESGPWDGQLERARCTEADHAPPGADCRCGLYGWYLPGSATVSLGPASAVIAARGRCVLGDRGFRAAEARIEAVALPTRLRWNRPAASKVRQMLAVRYPDTRVYSSVRQMVKDHPPHDVGALGLQPPVDRTRGYRTAAAATYVLGLVFLLVFAALPRIVGTNGFTHWWPVLVVSFVVAWQAGLVLLIARLLKLQTPKPADSGRR